MKQRFFISFGIKFQGHVPDFAIISLENLMKGNTSMSLFIFKASRVVEDNRRAALTTCTTSAQSREF